jgi:hypothetical protein
MSKRLELIGQTFNRLTVKNFHHVKNGKAYWLCICVCGKETISCGKELKSGKIKSCGCLHNNLFEDLIGKEFNYLTVIKLSHKDKYGKHNWLCRCKCGEIVIVIGSRLKTGKTKSCGSCIKRIDLVGKQFGRLLVLYFAEVSGRHTWWMCQCICGNQVKVRAQSLMEGYTQSCGCILKEVQPGFVTEFKNGTEAQRSFYQRWAGMKNRCYNPNDPAYKNYGGKGVAICDRWLEPVYGFKNFIDDKFDSFLKHVEEYGLENTSIDRINVKGNYESSNTRWATPNMQANNKRNSVKSANIKEHNYWLHYLGSFLSRAIAQHTKKSKLLEYYLGCSLPEFRNHIESQFESWMSWNNYGRGKNKWNFDHIIQVHTFDLSKEADRLVCFNFKNYRPYDAEKNNKEQSREVSLV